MNRVCDVYYISPSVVPSISANSVHVIMQTRALSDENVRVTLFACRSVSGTSELPDAIARQYGVDMADVRVVTASAGSGRGVALKITALVLGAAVRDGWPAHIISRNLYAAFVIGVVARRPLVFEIHELEHGLRGALQKALLRRPWIRIVNISEKLSRLLAETHGPPATRPQVLHDAAPAGITPVAPPDRHDERVRLVPESAGAWRGVCGYFGQLHAGRGIDVIASMAKRMPHVLFLIAGGREGDVATWKRRSTLENLIFLGHLPHHRAQQLSRCVDVLLMPYQRSVSIGLTGHDTAQWMSPMKMFEYMATGVPLVSSDLPVLREILRNSDNALLVPPDAVEAWCNAVQQLLDDEALASRIGAAAHAQYAARHTWQHRARALLEAP